MMPRAVPSQVAAYIAGVFPEQAREPGRTIHQVDIDYVNASRLAGLIDLVKSLPPELLSLEGEDYTAFVSNLAAIETALLRWRNTGIGSFRLEPLQRSVNALSPVAIIYTLLCQCPDSAAASGTADLAWIDDTAFREGLRIDLSSTNQGLLNGEWKAATVLGGSVIEALLLWRLAKEAPARIKEGVATVKAASGGKKNPKEHLVDWNLSDFIEVAAALSIIKTDTLTQARLAQNFRNLIHPGKELRGEGRCDRATALAAVSAVEHVLRDLTPAPAADVEGMSR